MLKKESKLKLLFLYWPTADYTLACLEELCRLGHEVQLVRYTARKEAPFKEDYIIPQNLSIRQRDTFKKEELFSFALHFNPDIIYISGWVDKEYLRIGRKFKSEGKPVIMALDNPWKGSLRQRLGLLVFKIQYSKSFTHAFPAGYRQFEFARKLGYKYENIIFNQYCARTSLFDSNPTEKRFEPNKGKKTLLYIGRLVPYKGILDLYNAFKEIELELDDKLDWELKIFGNGILEKDLKDTKSIKVKNFIQPSEISQLVAEAHAFCLPSYDENWGVVLHEFAAAGLVLLTTFGVSSREQFLINGFNGIVFKSSEIKKALLELFAINDTELLEMSNNSRFLSKRITPRTWAATILSVYN